MKMISIVTAIRDVHVDSKASFPLGGSECTERGGYCF